ncbi:13784_t:CDS:2, partial [Dentiscutata erythropus]
NVGFHDVERISSVSKLYNSCGVLVTNQDYSGRAKLVAHDIDIVLTYQNNIVKILDKRVKYENKHGDSQISLSEMREFIETVASRLKEEYGFFVSNVDMSIHASNKLLNSEYREEIIVCKETKIVELIKKFEEITLKRSNEDKKLKIEDDEKDKKNQKIKSKN